MRVIAGIARSMPLKTVEGLETRPTTDRIKETLFNILQMEISDCKFLDLFAGSGGIGIEALSRGGAKAVFVEHAKPAAACIRDNLNFTKLDSLATVMETDVLTAINRLSGQGTFDIVYMDPPYDQNLEQDVLLALAASKIITPETIIIIEESLDCDLSYIDSIGYQCYRTKEYKTNKHLFLHWEGSEK
jgi:16S rRNA (guanine966-N2)-methyltransferase